MPCECLTFLHLLSFMKYISCRHLLVSAIVIIIHFFFAGLHVWIRPWFRFLFGNAANVFFVFLLAALHAVFAEFIRLHTVWSVEVMQLLCARDDGNQEGGRSPKNLHGNVRYQRFSLTPLFLYGPYNININRVP